MRKLIRLSSAAERLGVKPSTLRDWFLKKNNRAFMPTDPYRNRSRLSRFLLPQGVEYCNNVDPLKRILSQTRPHWDQDETRPAVRWAF